MSTKHKNFAVLAESQKFMSTKVSSLKVSVQNIRNYNLRHIRISTTLTGKIFSGETFANVASFGFFRESLMSEKFEIVHPQKFISRISCHFSVPKFLQHKRPFFQEII